MEVHHHPHTPRKKWTHYFWEFLMLFLAVFCGFLAENQREHFVEHKREKQFIISLMNDLQLDTLWLTRVTANKEKRKSNLDSALRALVRLDKDDLAVNDSFDSPALLPFTNDDLDRINYTIHGLKSACRGGIRYAIGVRNEAIDLLTTLKREYHLSERSARTPSETPLGK